MLTKYGKTIMYVNNGNEIHAEDGSHTQASYAFKVLSGDWADNGNKVTYIIRDIDKSDLIDHKTQFPNGCRCCAFSDVINTFDLKFSSGTSAATEDTTVLYDLIDGLSEVYKKVLNATQETISYNNPCIISITKTVANNTNNDISIKTVYLYSSPIGRATDTATGEDMRAILIDWEILDDAITLHPGDKLTFTLLIR